MSRDATALAIAAVLVGGLLLSRRSEAGDVDVLREIQITAAKLGEGGLTIDDLLATNRSPSGIRRNNPLNIRETASQWQGELPHDGDGFEEFATADDGIRAGAKLLLNYWRFHRLNTIRGIITRWAPPSENPTANYVDFVSRRLDVDPDRTLNMDSVETITELAAAIIHFENGKQPYTRNVIRDNVQRAFA